MTDPAPRGAYRGCAPQLTACAPQTKIVPPQARTVLKGINRLGASGAQIEAHIGVFCGLTPNIVTFLGWRPFVFFLEITCIRPEKSLDLAISAAKSLEISVKTFFFFVVHQLSAEKTAWISAFGRKIPLNLCSSPCSFDPDWIISRALMPLSNSHKINFSCPPKFISTPPATLSWHRAWSVTLFDWKNDDKYYNRVTYKRTPLIAMLRHKKIQVKLRLTQLIGHNFEQLMTCSISISYIEDITTGM